MLATPRQSASAGSVIVQLLALLPRLLSALYRIVWPFSTQTGAYALRTPREHDPALVRSAADPVSRLSHQGQTPGTGNESWASNFAYPVGWSTSSYKKVAVRVRHVSSTALPAFSVRLFYSFCSFPTKRFGLLPTQRIGPRR